MPLFTKHYNLENIALPLIQFNLVEYLFIRGLHFRFSSIKTPRYVTYGDV